MIEQIGFGLPEPGEQGGSEILEAADDAVEVSGVGAGPEPELEVPLLSEPGLEKAAQFGELIQLPFRCFHGGRLGLL